MKAWTLKNIGHITLEDLPLPELKPGWVIVKVAYCGICSSDLPRVFTKGTYHFPTTIGHEFSGVVVHTSTPETAYLKNKPVSVFPLIPCKRCSSCDREQYETCSNYDYIGSRRDGAMAEFVAVPAWNVVCLKTFCDLKIASLLEPLSVAIHAVKRSKLSHSDSVAIKGSGLIGFAIALIVKQFGVKEITVFGRSLNKLDLASKLGLQYQYESKLYKNKFNVVFEAVGSSSSVTESINLLDTNGKLVLVGNPSKSVEIPQDVYWKVLRKQLYLIGTWNSQYRYNASSDWTEAVDFMSDNSDLLNLLVTHVYPFDQLVNALDMMRFNSETYCKVLIKW